MYKGADLTAPEFNKFEKLSDDFVVVANFDNVGAAEVKLDPTLKVSIVRLSIHQSSDNWGILSEIHFRQAVAPV